MTSDWSATSIDVLGEDQHARTGQRSAPVRVLLAVLVIVFAAAVVMTLGLPSYVVP